MNQNTRNSIYFHRFCNSIPNQHDSISLRMALEYYMIPNSSKFDAENIMQPVGQSSNSYVTINLGFILGGGRWQK